MFKVVVRITLRPSILDPQGKAIEHALDNLGLDGIQRVRVGKLIELWVDAADAAEARQAARSACEKLLANEVMENFEIEVERAAEAA